MRIFTVTLGLVLLGGFGCGGGTEPPSAANAPSRPPSLAERPPWAQPAIVPPGVAYEVVSTDVIPGRKRSLDVRLNQKVSEETLRAIALELKARDSHTYDRTFIAFYLPGMTINAGAWATTHFDPALEVRILGPTLADEDTLRDGTSGGGGVVIGRWIDNSPFVGGRITIAEEQGRLVLDQRLLDGSRGRVELFESGEPSGGRRFDPTEPSPTGDHWILDATGDLQIRDDEGLIATAKSAG